MTKLTVVQEQVLRIVADCFNETGSSPSLGEIASRRRCCRNSVVVALKRLERKQFIRRRGARGIEMLPLGCAFLAELENPWA